MSWSPSTLTGFIAASLLVASYGIYNAHLHPLRHFPGPKLWAAFRVPYVIKYLQGVLPYKVLDLHRQYGPVVRIAPDELAFTDAAAWHDIYGLQPNRQQNDLDYMTFTPSEPGMEESFAGATHATHARLRRIYSPALSSQAVDGMSDQFLMYANLLVSRLRSAISNPADHSTGVQDLHDWYNFVAFDVLGDFAFGGSFHCLENSKSHFFMRIIVPAIIAACKINQLERYGLYSVLKPLIPKSALQAKIDIDNYVEALVKRRLERKDGNDGNDVFSYLERSELSTTALQQNAIILVMAGSHTTATLLTAATYFLCKNPHAQKRVLEEVRTAFQADGEITVKAAQHLTYLNCVISETLRLVPGGAFGNCRWIRGKGGQMIAGHNVPQNTRCSIYHYTAYRYRGNFTRPEEFVPERWLQDTPSEFSQDHHRAFEPFNVGPRGRIGKTFGNVQVRTVLVKMLWHFDITLADPDDLWVDKLGAYPIWEKPPLLAKLSPNRR